MGRMTLTVYRDRSGQWRWKVTAANGRKVANGSEGYRRRVDCERMARKILRAF